jgi:hypothetical protein
LRCEIVVEAIFDTLDRKELRSCPPIFVDRQQLNRGEPVKAAGKARDLPIESERRIDESGWAKKGAHRAAL